MPAAFAVLANFTPQDWVLRAWKLSLAGAATANLVLSFVVSLALGVLMFAFGAVMFKRRYA